MRYIFFFIISFSTLFANAHIFVYHRFADERYSSANTTKEELIKQFEYFKKKNYEVVPLEKIVQKLKNGESIPEKWIALTIDDAYKSFYENGLEIFKQYNYPFTLYVYVEATNRKYSDYMKWDEIKEASKYGSIGLHSYGHPRLQNLTEQQIIEDTKKGYDLFVTHLGIDPTSYAYPYGEYDDRVKKTLKKHFDFEAILNQNTGSVNSKTDRFDIPRVALVGEVNIEHKLRYQTFDLEWIEPNEFPKDGILRRVHAKVDKKHKTLKLYITGEGWRDVPVQNGVIDIPLNIYLKNSRTRVIIGSDVFNIATKIINKVTTKSKEK